MALEEGDGHERRTVAKTALIRFSEGLAGQLAAHCVRVFAVHPGVVRTRLLQSYGLQIPDDWCVDLMDKRRLQVPGANATGRFSSSLILTARGPARLADPPAPRLRQRR